MIIIGIVLFVFSLFILILAWRGRIVAVGQFCRKCRFDLAGLDLASTQAKCPECGSEIHQEIARRPLIRRRSRLGLGIAAIVMLASGASIWVGATGKAGSFVAAMPDQIVFWLTDLGVDEALDELVVRVSRVPSTMSVEGWEYAIEAGLAYQADPTLVWDVRWGEVLYQGLNQSRMSDEQLKQYFVNAGKIELTVRDRVHPGDSGFGYMLEWKSTRSRVMTFGTVDYQLNRLVNAYGVQGEEPIWTRDPDNRNGSFPLSFSSYAEPSWGRSTTWKMHDYFAQEPGNVVDVYFDYEMAVVPIGEAEPIFTHSVREEFVIQIVDKDEPIVRTNTDEEAIRRVMDNMQIAPLKIMSQIEELKPNYYTQIMRTMLASQVPLGSLSMEVFLLIDGQEIMVGSITHNSTHASYRGHVSFGVKPGDKVGLDVATRVHTRLLKDQSVTVIVRTNAALVENIPGIEKVLGVEFMFENVPIEIVETSSELNTPNRDGAQGKAVPIAD